ncbi:DUF4393 domain-containing protein [Aerococcus urinaeequi]|uniref:DUF4393 domain-containing protein n=1 Tax=Aerococcus urinaeequi TaxID=51665 RepID=UPI003B3AB1DF
MNNNELDPWFNMIPNSALEELANPIAHEIGQGLGGIASFILNPARKLGIVSRKNLEEFEEKIYYKTKEIPEEDRDDSKQGLALKALEDSAYQLESETLQEMFSNLIASSLDNRINKDVHPLYSSILKDLTSLDAQIFQTIYFSNVVPTGGMSFIHPSTGNNVVVNENVILTPREFIDQPNAVKTLEIKGLIDVYSTKYLVDSTHQQLYKNFENSDDITEYIERNKTRAKEYNLIPKPFRGHIKVSSLGKAFGKVVITDR